MARCRVHPSSCCCHAGAAAHNAAATAARPGLVPSKLFLAGRSQPSLHLLQVVGHLCRREDPELAVLPHNPHLNVLPRELACGEAVAVGWGGCLAGRVLVVGEWGRAGLQLPAESPPTGFVSFTVRRVQ